MGDTAIQSLLRAPEIDQCKKVLCIQPHPDDNEVGMGGIIAYLVRKGCQVDYLTVTDGRLGDMSGNYKPEELARLRREETEAAGHILGAEQFYYLDLKDGALNDIPGLAGQIAELVRQNQYDTLFCPDPWSYYEAHWDHVVTGRAAAQSAISCSLAAYPEGTSTPACELSGVGFYFTSAPNTVVDITELYELKFEAMAAHKTQMPLQIVSLYHTYFAMKGRQLTGSEAIGEGVKMLAPLHLHCFTEAQSIL